MLKTKDLGSFARRLCRISAVMLFAACTAYSQVSTGTVTGFLRDQSGAVLPGVTVTVTNIDRNTSQTTITNDLGTYVVPALNPGNYSVSAELPGFKKFLREGLTLQVNQVLRIDVELQLGAVDQTIQVTEAAPLLDTETSSRGSVIDGKKIVELPLNGRDYNQLALLSPGVLPSTPRLASVNFKGAINVNGNRVFNNVFLLDGVDNVSYASSFRGENVQVIQPSVEALQEFKIQTNAYSAEFGRSSGAVVNATIKSGSNALHGSIYEFIRNDMFDANNYFSNAFGQPKPVRKRNQFGGAVGGPLVKDRTFWFADYEGLREREGVPRTRAVPTADEKAGIFSTAVFDPFAAGRPEFSRDAQGRWIIPPSRWDPVAAKIIPLIPDPNAPGGIYASTPITASRADQFDARIDHQVAQNIQLFGRYSFVDSNVFRPAPLPGLAEGSFNDAFGANKNRSQGVAVGVTWTFSPRLVGDLRLGWARGNYFTTPPNAGVDAATQVGLKNVPNSPDVTGGLPKINLQGFDAIGRHTSTPQFQTPRSWDPRATFSMHAGRHSLKFGTEVLKLSTSINDLNATIGRLNFDNRYTGRAVGDFLLGMPTQLALTSYTIMHQRQDMYFFFLQDDFRVNNRLTLNLGLRYEYASPVKEQDNQLANFDPVTASMIFSKDGSTYDRTLIHPDRNNWAPRLGFAYSVGPGWAMRGAYGVFYSHTVRQGREGMLGFNPPYLVDNLLQTSVSGATATAGNALFLLKDGYPQGLLDPTSLAPSVSRRAQDPNQRSAYIQQFNFGIQRELASNLLLDVGYIGNKGTKLPGFRNINPQTVITNANGTQSAGPRPYPAFGDIQWLENRVLSNYNSLQAGLEKRFSQGVSGLVSYTWGKALSESPDHISTSGGGAGLDTGVFKSPQDGNNLKAEKGLAEFDVKQRFVASYVWELPFGKGRHWGQAWNRGVDTILGGWSLSGIHTVQGGLGLTATLGGSSVLSLGGERQARPNLVGNPVLPAGERTVDRWFNTDAFAAFTPAPQAFGTAGVGIMRGPSYINSDFTLSKKIPVTETRYFQFRTELFNAFNHANFNPPDIRRDASTFGRILSASNARIIQFALKAYF